MRSELAVLLVSTGLAVAGCGDDAATDPDAATDAATDGSGDGGFVEPSMLSQTGLYADIGAGTLAEGVVEFAPRWRLWSDRAIKRRFVWLPPGSTIDTADMDFWHLPIGTKLWKEFTRDGVRVETRLLQKIGPSDDVADWFMVAFQWNQTQTDAAAVPGGVVDDQGNDDIPSRSDCRKCHGSNRIPSVALGFSALQLDFPGVNNQLILHTLVGDGRLTTPPTGGSATTPYFPLPAGDVERDAIGYLHGNCGGCHNQYSDVKGTTSMELRLSTSPSALLSWMATPTWQYTVDKPTQVGPGTIIVSGNSGTSVLYQRLTAIGGTQMPPVGRETVDPTGSAAVQTWIDNNL